MPYTLSGSGAAKMVTCLSVRIDGSTGISVASEVQLVEGRSDVSVSLCPSISPQAQSGHSVFEWWEEGWRMRYSGKAEKV